MVLDTARPRYKENTTWLGMRGRDAARKSTPKVNTLQVFTIVSQRSSLSCITTRVRIVRTSAKRWDELAKEDHSYIQTHSRGKEKIPRTLVSYFEQNRQKWAYDASICLQSRCHNEKSITPRSQENQLKILSIQVDRRIQQG